MAAAELRRIGGIAYREAVPDGAPRGDAVLCLHGFPEGSYMWRGLLETSGADAGRRAVAPDTAGFGATAPDSPGTWECQGGLVARFRPEPARGRVGVVVRGW